MFYIIGTLFAVIAGVILLVSVIGGGGNGVHGSQVATAFNEVSEIREGVVNSGFTDNFVGLDNAILEESGVMPPEIIAGAVGAGNDIDPWGGSVIVQYTGNVGCYELVLEDVPQSACIYLASQIGPSCPGWSAIYINFAWYGTPLDRPLPQAGAAAYCAAGNNQLDWMFND